jgi:hypothetical protein
VRTDDTRELISCRSVHCAPAIDIVNNHTGLCRLIEAADIVPCPLFRVVDSVRVRELVSRPETFCLWKYDAGENSLPPLPFSVESELMRMYL